MEKKKIKHSWIFRGCSVGILLFYSQRIKEMALDEEIFKEIEENLYVFTDEAINILFHLTRIFVCFREADKYFPRKNGESFKSFAAEQEFHKQDLKKIKQGVVYIADNVETLLQATLSHKHLEIHSN